MLFRSAAEELKYIGALKRQIGALFSDPSEDWVKFLTAKVYDRSVTARVKEQFTPLVAKASRQYLRDQVNERLKVALGDSNAGVSGGDDAAVELPSQEVTDQSLADMADDDGIETTVEELEGFHIVRAIVCSDIDAARITHRDAKSYFAVLIDDNNRKPVVRLHFNRTQKYVGILDETKKETRHPIGALSDIYQFADDLRAAVARYAD